MTKPALILKDVRFAYPGLGGFSFEVPRFDMAAGESVLLLGQSGSGKSTLLSLIAGILEGQSGDIEIAGQSLLSAKPGARDRMRAELIGLIFQQFNLLLYASVADNILLPLRFAAARRARAKGRADVVRLLDTLGLPTTVTDTPASRLSVGQQQRVAAARALIGAPPLIIADEPTSALDASAQDSFLALLFDQCAGAGSALLMVSHDERLATRFDRVVRLSDIAQTHAAEALT